MQTWKRIYRWSLFTGGLTALFWAIYYFITGHVPDSQIVGLSDTPTFYYISRLWDILIGPICATCINLIWMNYDENSDYNDYRSIATFLIAILGLIGIIWGAGVGLTGLAIVAFAFGVIGAFILALIIIFLIASLTYCLGNTRLGAWLLAHSSKSS